MTLAESKRQAGASGIKVNVFASRRVRSAERRQIVAGARMEAEAARLTGSRF